MTPKDYNLPHKDFRKGQLECIQEIEAVRKRYVIVSAKTGTGKSAVGLALSHSGKTVRVATHTKSLQTQYSDYPKTQTLFGMANYPCALLDMYNADMCTYGKNMYDCPVWEECQYLIQRERTKISKRQILNYAYLLSASWTRTERPEYLYLDEGHLLPQIVMSEMELIITPRQCAEWDLPYYPDNLPSTPIVAAPIAAKWLDECIAKLESQEEDLYKLIKSVPHLANKYKAVQLMRRKMESIYRPLLEHKEYFFIEPKSEQLRIIPLTPKPFFRPIFAGLGNKKVITSATIGDYSTYCKILGIPGSIAHYIDVPSNFGPKEMPVYRFRDAPRMKANSPYSAYEKQADLAAEVFKLFSPYDTLGLVHTASKKASHSFARLLRSRLGDRVWVHSERGGTEQKIAAWQRRCKQHPNTIAVSWCFGTGVDARDVKVNLSQKVPFGTLDAYGTAQKDFSPELYLHNAAVAIEQQAGRNRRGFPEHYEVEGEPMRRFVGVLDNHLSMVKELTSSHFQKCLTYY